MRLADLKDRSVAVWGTGREGRAALRAIARQRPARLLAVDHSVGFGSIRWEAELAPLAGGDHAFPTLVAADVVVVSAGVPRDHPWRTEIRQRGIVVTTGSSLWLADHAARTIAVTGGDGRSVTAALIGHLLAATGRPGVLGGGAGEPLLELPEAEQYVVELSGEQCADLTGSPRVAVVTGLPAVEPSGAEGAGERPGPGQSGVGRSGVGPSGVERSGERPGSGRSGSGRAAAEAGSDRHGDLLNLLRHGPEMIVVDGTDLRLRDAIRGITDVNRFPPVPAGADDSRFRVEAETVYCSDDPLFRWPARPPVDRNSLCVALAVLDGLGVDVVARKADLAAAVASFDGAPLAEIPDPSESL